MKPSQDGLTALGSVGAGLQGVAQNLSTMADNYEGVDSSVAQGFGQIHQGLS